MRVARPTRKTAGDVFINVPFDTKYERLYLALVTGLFALTLYYYGLQRTPALLSSLAELTYPAIAVIAGIAESRRSAPSAIAFEATGEGDQAARPHHRHRMAIPRTPSPGNEAGDRVA